MGTYTVDATARRVDNEPDGHRSLPHQNSRRLHNCNTVCGTTYYVIDHGTTKHFLYASSQQTVISSDH